MADSDTSPRNITTDHETIREWVEQRGGTPAHVIGAPDDESSLYIVREDEEMAEMESLTWDEFFETFDSEGLAFVYQDREVGETDEWLYDIVDRDEIAERASLERTEIEEKLLEGEVVRSEITETKVIEKTVVETEEIESEVVDSEIIETTPVDREVISRQIVAGRFEDAPSGLTATLLPEGDEQTAAATEADREMAAGRESDTDTDSDTDIDTDTDTDETVGEPAAEPVAETTGEPVASHVMEEPTAGLAVDDTVVLDVQDRVLTTTEVFDRKTVESRVVERDVSEEDVVESDAIDITGVEETILESDLIEGEIAETEPEGTRREAVPGGAITSERTEGDTVRSQFVERRLVETESTEHHQISCDISTHKLVDTIDSRSNVTERAIVDREADEEVMLREPEAGVRTTDEQVTAAEETATAAEADAELAAEPEGEAGEAGPTTDTADTGGVLPTDDDIGKTVVSGDEEIGMVSDVEDETLYVDPDPSMTDRIKAALDWGEAADDTYPVEHEQIAEITDDEVRIREL